MLSLFGIYVITSHSSSPPSPSPSRSLPPLHLSLPLPLPPSLPPSLLPLPLPPTILPLPPSLPQIEELLNSSPVWSTYKDQKHDFFISSTPVAEYLTGGTAPLPSSPPPLTEPPPEDTADD